MPAPPSERRIQAQIAANESWARTADRSKRTAKARAAMLQKFEQQVDPDGTLLPAERQKRAESARRAYFQRLALRSAQSRRRAREATAAAEAAEAELKLAGGDPA